MQEEAASPTAATEAILLTGVIKAKQCRDIMTLDNPNSFLQTQIPQDGDKVMIQIRETLLDILCEICPGVYDNFVIYEGKQKQFFLYVRMIKTLYGMMITSILYYKKFRKEIHQVCGKTI